MSTEVSSQNEKENTLSKKEKMKTHTKLASISTLPHIHTLVHYSNNNQAARNHLESQFRDCPGSSQALVFTGIYSIGQSHSATHTQIDFKVFQERNNTFRKF